MTFRLGRLVRWFHRRTFSEEQQQQLSFLQLQDEAVLAAALGPEEHPGVPQGLEGQGDARPGRPPRPRAQPEEEAAAAAEAHHVGA